MVEVMSMVFFELFALSVMMRTMIKLRFRLSRMIVIRFLQIRVTVSSILLSMTAGWDVDDVVNSSFAISCFGNTSDGKNDLGVGFAGGSVGIDSGFTGGDEESLKY